MLRRFAHSGPPLAVVAEQIRSLSTSTVRRSPNTNNEESEDARREQELRKQFAEKMMGRAKAQHAVRDAKTPWQMFKALNEAAREQAEQRAQASGAANGGANPMGGVAQPQGMTLLKQVVNILFYVSVIYIVLFVLQFTDPNSRISLFTGVPWWAQPLDDVMHYTLLRSILGAFEVRRVQQAFESARKANPYLTLSQYIAAYEPQLFAGHRTSSGEIVAALSAAFASCNDISKVNALVTSAVAGTSDTRQCVDQIMDALRRDFPAVFAPVPTPVAFQ